MEHNEIITFNEKKLKKIIRDVLDEYFDPDYGNELRPEFIKLLKESKEEEKNGNLFDLEEIKKELK